MIKQLRISRKRPGLWFDGNVTFATVDNWYGHTTRDLKMDIIYPFEGEVKPWPCIMWICGGAWMQMDYHAHLPEMMHLAEKGFVIASMEYRDSNAVQFPGQLEDIKRAIRFIRTNAGRYNVDPEHIGIMGESAGGHLAALAGTTGRNPMFDTGQNSDISSSVQAVCTWYMVSDFSLFPPITDRELLNLSPESRLMGENLGDNPAKASYGSPVSYITEDAPPFLLLHGTKDTTVPYSQSEIMYEKLQENGIESTLVLIEEAEHSDIRFFQEPVQTLISDFFNKHLTTDGN